MSLQLYPIEATLPHRPPMILIEDMVLREAGRITVGVTVRSTAMFFQGDRGIPAHIALEWMAQACAAYGGAVALDDGDRPRVGFLLGSRDFQAYRSWFGEGDRLHVAAAVVYQDAELANFSCAVSEALGGAVVARASLTVLHPRDVATVIEPQAADAP